jgi:hypothetical protein
MTITPKENLNEIGTCICHMVYGFMQIRRINPIYYVSLIPMFPCLKSLYLLPALPGGHRLPLGQVGKNGQIVELLCRHCGALRTSKCMFQMALPKNP